MFPASATSPENGVVEDGASAYTAEVTVAVKTVEERLTVVEQQVAENARGIEGLREAVAELGRRMDRGFEAMEQRFDQRLDRLDEKMSRQFLWVVGLLITTVLAMTGAMAAIAAAMAAIAAAALGR